MDNQLKGIFGAWIQAIGTVISAIGSTPPKGINKEFQFNLNLWGNVLQAMGNAVLVDVHETFTFEKTGNEVQAIGNSTIIAAIIISFSEETKQLLTIKGNFLQALGGGVALVEDLGHSVSSVETLSVTGDILQIIGNSIQAIGGIIELKKSNEDKIEDVHSDNFHGKSLDVFGSWIQAVGSVLAAIAQTKEIQNDKKNNDSEENE